MQSPWLPMSSTHLHHRHVKPNLLISCCMNPLFVAHSRHWHNTGKWKPGWVLCWIHCRFWTSKGYTWKPTACSLGIALLSNAGVHGLTLEQDIRPHWPKTSYPGWPLRFVTVYVLFWIVENLLGTCRKVRRFRPILSKVSHTWFSRSLNGALSECPKILMLPDIIFMDFSTRR